MPQKSQVLNCFDLVICVICVYVHVFSLRPSIERAFVACTAELVFIHPGWCWPSCHWCGPTLATGHKVTPYMMMMMTCIYLAPLRTALNVRRRYVGSCCEQLFVCRLSERSHQRACSCEASAAEQRPVDTGAQGARLTLAVRLLAVWQSTCACRVGIIPAAQSYNFELAWKRGHYQRVRLSCRELIPSPFVHSILPRECTHRSTHRHQLQAKAAFS